MKKTVILFLVLASAAAAASYSLEYRVNSKGARCISNAKPCTRFRGTAGELIIRYSDRDTAEYTNGLRVTEYHTGKKEILYPDKTKAVRSADMSVVYYYRDGRTKKISMDGMTPWGDTVEKHSRTVKRKHFTVIIIYSDSYSDDNMNKYSKAYYEELDRQFWGWMHKNNLPQYRLNVVISNCRHGKTGFCKRKNKKEIAVTAFRNNTLYRTFSFQYAELLVKNAFIGLAEKTVVELMR